MLVKMMPEQVMHYWDNIKEALKGTLPPYVTDSPDKMMKIQAGFLGELVQCWVSVNDKPDVVGFVVTRVLYDDFTDSTNLLIISIYTFEKSTKEDWLGGFETIRKFAKGRGCDKIIAYTNEDKILKVVEMFGGVAEYTFVSIDL